MNELQLHDIKPLVNVPDFSLFIFIVLLCVGLLLVSCVGYLIYHFFKYRKKNVRKTYYKQLQNIDLNDSKTSAYTLTKIGRILAKSDREKKFYYALVDELEAYKYKKEVKPFDKQTLFLYHTFMDEIDV